MMGKACLLIPEFGRAVAEFCARIGGVNAARDGPPVTVDGHSVR